MGRTTDEIRKRIRIKKVRLNRELNDDEIRRIVKNVKIKIKRENFIRGALLALGITIGAGGHALLTAGNNSSKNENKIEAEEQENNQNPKNEFKEGLVVEVPGLDAENIQNEDIRENVKNEIDNLYSSEEVLDYVKKIYINEYNERNTTNYTIDQLTIYKERYMGALHEDTAANGDTIIRSGLKEGRTVDTEAGVIKSIIRGEEGIISEKVVNTLHDQYKTVYSENEEVLKYEDNFLKEMAPILSAGIDWSVAIHQEGTSSKVKEQYKNRLIDTVTNYKAQEKENTEEMDNEI